MENHRSLSFPDSVSDGSGSDYSGNCNSADDYFSTLPYFPQPVLQYGYSLQPTFEMSPAAIPIEFGIESLYEDLNRHKQSLKTSKDKSATTQVHSRRRAQNRASQRAFRERKEKHVKEVEKQFRELEGRYDVLSQSYETLQREYVCVKKELDNIVGKERRSEDFSRSSSVGDVLQTESPFEISKEDAYDDLVFDGSLFRFADDDEDISSTHQKTR